MVILKLSNGNVQFLKNLNGEIVETFLASCEVQGDGQKITISDLNGRKNYSFNFKNITLFSAQSIGNLIPQTGITLSEFLNILTTYFFYIPTQTQNQEDILNEILDNTQFLKELQTGFNASVMSYKFPTKVGIGFTYLLCCIKFLEETRGVYLKDVFCNLSAVNNYKLRIIYNPVFIVDANYSEQDNLQNGSYQFGNVTEPVIFTEQVLDDIGRDLYSFPLLKGTGNYTARPNCKIEIDFSVGDILAFCIESPNFGDVDTTAFYGSFTLYQPNF